MDILLDPVTHDVVFINGTSPVARQQQDLVAQRLKVTLQTFLGEWFLDLDTGIPYYQQILNKVRSKSTVDTIFQQAILNDPGVVELLSYESELNAASRGFQLNFLVRVLSGEEVALDFTITVGV